MLSERGKPEAQGLRAAASLRAVSITATRDRASPVLQAALHSAGSGLWLPGESPGCLRGPSRAPIASPTPSPSSPPLTQLASTRAATSPTSCPASTLSPTPGAASCFPTSGPSAKNTSKPSSSPPQLRSSQLVVTPSNYHPPPRTDRCPLRDTYRRAASGCAKTHSARSRRARTEAEWEQSRAPA